MDRLTRETLAGPPFVAPLPHVVILGAGASRAAFPQGDKNGRCLPLLEDLPEILGNSWANLVRSSRTPVVGFEAQFAWMRRHTEFAEALYLIEGQITEYFEGLELPDGPTIYDYLVLGLRPKDTIATFNWDPLLLLAHKRNRNVASLPDTRFLHGCVSFTPVRITTFLAVLTNPVLNAASPSWPVHFSFPTIKRNMRRIQ
jgi:hypothetical protein